MKSRTYGHQDLRPLTQYLNCLKTFRNMKQIDLYPLGYIIEAETFHMFRLNTNLISEAFLVAVYAGNAWTQVLTGY